jgi:hypothetical protein
VTALLGTTGPVYLGLTVVVMGFAAYVTGQAVASTWRPAWQVVVYGALLGIVDRFLAFALFKGQLFSLAGYLVGSATLIAIGLFAYGVTRAHCMTRQYPWLYERDGLFGWRKKG